MKIEFYCPHCGSLGQPKTRVKGSIWIELLLWLCLFVPGFVYSIWRLTTKEKVCPQCGAPHMIPADSPKARAMLQTRCGKEIDYQDEEARKAGFGR